VQALELVEKHVESARLARDKEEEAYALHRLGNMFAKLHMAAEEEAAEAHAYGVAYGSV
jgi:hypothetical protein